MRKITKETVFAERKKEIQSAYFQDGKGGQRWDGLQIKSKNSTFSAYVDSVGRILEVQTGIKLKRPSKYQGYWKNVNEEEIAKIETWMRSQGTLVFLQDCLSISLALSTNYTSISSLMIEGKQREDENSIRELADIVEQQIRNLPYYKDADLICSVPSVPDKGFDLPKRVVCLVNEKINKQNITGGFVFGEQKSPIRTTPLEEKWQVWEDAQVSFQNSDEFNVNDKTVILVDDMYQSGTTIQYIAMKLQQAGAREVYGLSLVKTVKNTDNM